ncbi:uncharacterized protein LOC129595773 isoform X2 [Paramacrobiotus metropolitanus]|uniref:uncharacterized protein LOC129595773 isoform X2 n=1 Tax=Paramacrobiotus metropolitanus TaxID=2943436 RepID=UPI0024463150|nr:uncharacterized protein LOC129595773 isoform X2 [Paramacrobiotus metropolitanus]
MQWNDMTVIYQPNSVDVLGDDGVLRYGRVVDVADTGLFIDFFCPNRRRELIPFGGVYLPTALEPLDLDKINEPHAGTVEVLIREAPRGPWMWVPAEVDILASHEDLRMYGMVAVSWWKKTEHRDILPVQRLRRRYARPCGWWSAVGRSAVWQFATRLIGRFMGNLEGGASQPVVVAKGMFSKWSVPLPEGYEHAEVWNDLKRLNFKLMFSYERFCCVGIADGRLLFIERRLSAEETTSVTEARDLRLRETLHDHAFLDELQLDYRHQPTGNPSAHIDSPADAFSALPRELWLEVLSHLDTREQNRLRAVCSAWDGIADALAASVVLWMGNLVWRGPPGVVWRLA